MKRSVLSDVSTPCSSFCSDLCVSCSVCCSCSCKCGSKCHSLQNFVQFYLLDTCHMVTKQLKHLCCDYQCCRNYCSCHVASVVPDCCHVSPELPDTPFCDDYQCLTCRCSVADPECGSAQCCCLAVR